MIRWEHTYIWCEGSAIRIANDRFGDTTPPIGKEVIDKLNALGVDGWEIAQITAAPLATDTLR